MRLERSTPEAARGVVLERNGTALPDPDPSHFYGAKRSGPPKARRIQPMGPMPDRDEDLPSAASAGPFPPVAPATGAPTPKETTMPRGVYDRSKAKPRAKKAEKAPTLEDTMRAPTAAAQEKKATRAKRGPKKASRANPVPSPRKPAGPAFGIYEDGTVVIDTAGCQGKLSPDEAKRLVAFIGRNKAR